MKKILYVVNILVFVLVVWGIFSFVEINSKNKKENPVYSPYNIFIIFEKNS